MEIPQLSLLRRARSSNWLICVQRLARWADSQIPFAQRPQLCF
jgi:hypothetical protein